jgi:hypothetical protein
LEKYDVDWINWLNKWAFVFMVNNTQIPYKERISQSATSMQQVNRFWNGS